MNIDDIVLEVRPRRRWEAIDLGFVLARACFKPLWGAFALVFIPTAVVIIVLLRDKPWLAALIIWWLKPLFDRVALHVLSRAVFSATPDVRATLRALPGLLRVGLIGALTYLRVYPARSLILAFWQLEGLRGRAWRNRLRLIERGTRSTATWNTVVCLIFELILAMSTIGLAYWLLPPEIASLDWFEDSSGGGIADWIALGAWILAVVAVEPLYVAGGFVLYLNRRTQLEAWDLEIAFRRLAGRLVNDEPAAA